jgi:hypothetical protein
MEDEDHGIVFLLHGFPHFTVILQRLPSPHFLSMYQLVDSKLSKVLNLDAGKYLEKIGAC